MPNKKLAYPHDTVPIYQLINDTIEPSIQYIKKILNISDVYICHMEMNSLFPEYDDFIHNECKCTLHGTSETNNPLILTWNKYDRFVIGIKECTAPSGIKFCILVTRDGNSNLQNVLLVVDRKMMIRLSLEIHHYDKNVQNKDIVAPILDKKLFKDLMDNSLEFLRLIKRNAHLKIKAKRGLILTGKPGNGKTMFIRYLAEVAKKHGFSIAQYTAAHLQQAFSHNSLPNLFYGANLIFFDDIDIGCFNRSVDGRLTCAILSAMDGIIAGKNINVVRIFTTNEPIKNMDPAFCRPGRIDKIFHFELPTHELRREFINTWSKKEILDKIDVENLVDKSEGLSFAQIDEIRNDILLQQLRTGKIDVAAAIDGLYDISSENTNKIGFN